MKYELRNRHGSESELKHGSCTCLTYSNFLLSVDLKFIEKLINFKLNHLQKLVLW